MFAVEKLAADPWQPTGGVMTGSSVGSGHRHRWASFTRLHLDASSPAQSQLV